MEWIRLNLQAKTMKGKMMNKLWIMEFMIFQYAPIILRDLFFFSWLNFLLIFWGLRVKLQILIETSKLKWKTNCAIDFVNVKIEFWLMIFSLKLKISFHYEYYENFDILVYLNFNFQPFNKRIFISESTQNP